MNDGKESIGSWTTWARFVIETLKSLCEQIKDIQNRIDELIDKSECEKNYEEIKNSIKSLSDTLNNARALSVSTENQLKNHVEKHEYKWKIVAVISVVVGLILSLLKLFEYLK